MQGATVVEEARDALQQLTVDRGQIVASVLVVVLAVIVGFVVIPFVIARIRDAVTSKYVTGRTEEVFDSVEKYTPTTMSELALRTGQVVVLGSSLLALLIVWGQVSLAVAVIEQAVTAVPNLLKFVLTLTLILFAFVGSDQLKRAVKRFSARTGRVTDHQEEIVLRVGQVAWFLTIGSAILTLLWGFDISGLLVGAGFLGIVVGFAARQTLGSMIAGFVLMVSRPFTIGDWVEIGGEEGIVTDIMIFNTRLENFDGEFIFNRRNTPSSTE